MNKKNRQRNEEKQNPNQKGFVCPHCGEKQGGYHYWSPEGPGLTDVIIFTCQDCNGLLAILPLKLFDPIDVNIP